MELIRLSTAAMIILASACLTWSAEPDANEYLADGRLKQPLKLSHVQLGGFAGRLETTIAIDDDNSWSGSFGVGGRAQTREGKLTGEQLDQLAAALAEHDLAGLPKTIGADKPVKSPREIADGASTTITLTFGEQKVTAHFADGVENDEATQKLRQRLQAIENAMRKVTLNTPK